jgi:hypothetical protein
MGTDTIDFKSLSKEEKRDLLIQRTKKNAATEIANLQQKIIQIAKRANLSTITAVAKDNQVIILKNAGDTNLQLIVKKIDDAVFELNFENMSS